MATGFATGKARRAALAGGTALFLASAIAACGSSGNATGGQSSASAPVLAPAGGAPPAQSGTTVSAPVDACKVLDPDTAKTAIDSPVGTPQSDDAGAKCSYDASDDSGGNVTLEMHAIRGNSSADDLLARGGTPVAGLGDKAYWNTSLSTLVVYRGQGDVVVQVVAGFGHSVDAQDHARVIAQKALAAQ